MLPNLLTQLGLLFLAAATPGCCSRADGISAFYDADQLYNLNDDPNEQTNLAKKPEHAAKLKELREALEKNLKTMPGTFCDLTE